MESMRLHPINPVIPRLVVEPFEVGGYRLPPGVHVAVNTRSAHHRPESFHNPDAFRPDRFMGTAPDRYTWLPFGGGARKCVGMALGQRKTAAIIARSTPRLVSPGTAREATIGDMAAPAGGPQIILAPSAPAPLER